MSGRFKAETWISDWRKVGGIVSSQSGVGLLFDLDGNAAEQRHLLGKLDGKRGRREAVRDTVRAVESQRG